MRVRDKLGSARCALRVASSFLDADTTSKGRSLKSSNWRWRFFNEQLPDHLDVQLVIACHDELVVECSEEQAAEVAGFLEDVMVSKMDEVLNPGSCPGRSGCASLRTSPTCPSGRRPCWPRRRPRTTS